MKAGTGRQSWGENRKINLAQVQRLQPKELGLGLMYSGVCHAGQRRGGLGCCGEHLRPSSRLDSRP